MVVAPAALGVNVAVYVVPDPEKLLRIPPATVISPDAKSVVGLLEVKVNAMLVSFVVDPFVTPLVVDVIVMVGDTLSYVQLNWVVAVLLLPATSVNFELATSIVVAPAELGVNVAVYVVPDPEKLLIEPFVTVISPDTKLVVTLLEVKVNAMLESFVVDPSVTPLVVDAIVMVGATLS